MKRRVRAAWSYSLLEQSELAEAMGVSPDTLRGWLRKGGPVVKLDRALSIADACGVPRDFVLYGWDGPPAVQHERSIEERLAAVERLLADREG